ncbi:MAG: PAS domain S-box protein [Bacteroidetes bacterium]|nr:PAS domain S-box protein [Bacteroidota bacterium]
MADIKYDSETMTPEHVLQSAGVGIYAIDRDGQTIFANQAAVQMVGWELDELKGKLQHQLIHHTKPNGDHYKEEECPLHHGLKDDKIFHIDSEVFWRKNGSCFPVEYIRTPIKDKSGEIIGAVISFKDITKQKQSEEALRQVNNKLQLTLSAVEEENVKLRQEHSSIEMTSISSKKDKIPTLTENERTLILKTLEKTKWRVSGVHGAAKILDINRTTLEARMRKLKIFRHQGT